MPQLKQYNQLVSTAHIPVDAVLLDNVTANTSGAWKWAGTDGPTVVTVEGVNGGYTATVEIHVSTQPSIPADSDNTRIIMYTVSNASQAFDVPQGYRWIKARVTGYTGGTIYAGLIARGR